MHPTDLFKVLSDETRLRILHLILKNTELCVCEITGTLEISQPKISRHLAVLRSSTLLNTRKEGQWVFYSISENLPAWANEILQLTLVACNDIQPYKNDITELSSHLLSSCGSC